MADVEKKSLTKDFPGGPVGKTPHFHYRDTGLIPGQGTRSYMLQPRVHKIPRAAHKDQKSRVPWVRRGAAESINRNTKKEKENHKLRQNVSLLKFSYHNN